MRTHDLKTWPEFFAALMSGAKTFEIRKDDRGFMVGDALCLREWDPAPYSEERDVGPKGFTGREMVRVITYKFAGGRYGIPEGVCVLGIARPTPEASPDKEREG